MILVFKILEFFLPTQASAHEAYVLPHNTFWGDLGGTTSLHAFDAWKDPHNVRLTLIIAFIILVVLGLNYLFRESSIGQKFFSKLEEYSKLGPHLVRFTIAAALFFSAASNAFLGPELSIDSFPFSGIVRIILFTISIMVALGFLTELAALAGIVLFVAGFFAFGGYMFTYFNYLGELIVLLLFGMRIFSIDKYIFGPLRHLQFFEKYETAIVRVMYGFALFYAGITVKLLHPDLTLLVVNNWHLTQFHWLFPSDPLLVTLGTGIVESLMGLFIIFGFELRLTVFISLFYITLSLFYFKELVWPHLLLYGISLNILLQPEIFTIDHILFSRHRKKKSWWKRPFASHNEEGKSAIIAK